MNSVVRRAANAQVVFIVMHISISCHSGKNRFVHVDATGRLCASLHSWIFLFCIYKIVLENHSRAQKLEQIIRFFIAEKLLTNFPWSSRKEENKSPENTWLLHFYYCTYNRGGWGFFGAVLTSFIHFDHVMLFNFNLIEETKKPFDQFQLFVWNCWARIQQTNWKFRAKIN